MEYKTKKNTQRLTFLTLPHWCAKEDKCICNKQTSGRKVIKTENGKQGGEMK